MSFKLKPQNDELFVFQSSDVKGCPVAKQPVIYMSRELYDRLVGLCRQFDTEWLGYLTGKLEGYEAVIDGVYFPPQTATGSHCENVQDLTVIQDGTVGAIHSHVGMGVFWSPEDVAHANWPVEMVMNNKGHVKGLVRVQLRCGEHERVDAKVVARGTPIEDPLAASLKEALQVGAKHEQEKAPRVESDITVYDRRTVPIDAEEFRKGLFAN